MKWVSVEDEMPPKNTFVIALSKLGIDVSERTSSCHFRGKWLQDEDEITHWMPLPEPPELQK